MIKWTLLTKVFLLIEQFLVFSGRLRYWTKLINNAELVLFEMRNRTSTICLFHYLGLYLLLENTTNSCTNKNTLVNKVHYIILSKKSVHFIIKLVNSMHF
jgi:hypothetical protein